MMTSTSAQLRHTFRFQLTLQSVKTIVPVPRRDPKRLNSLLPKAPEIVEELNNLIMILRPTQPVDRQHLKVALIPPPYILINLSRFLRGIFFLTIVKLLINFGLKAQLKLATEPLVDKRIRDKNRIVTRVKIRRKSD